MAKRAIEILELPSEVASLLATIGVAVHEARLRRGWTQKLLAEKANVTYKTAQAVEGGRPGTAIASVLSVLWALRLTAPLQQLDDPANDRVGVAMDVRAVRERARRAPRGDDLDTDF